MNFFDMLVIDNEKPNKSQSLSQNPNELMWDHQTSTSANVIKLRTAGRMFSVEKLSYYVDSHEDGCDIKGIPYTFDFRLQI